MLPASVVVLLVLGGVFLPGALALGLARKFQTANYLEWLFTAITLGVLATGWFALTLAEFSLFSCPLLVGAWIGGVGILGVLRLRRTPLRRLMARWTTQRAAVDAPAAQPAVTKWELGALVVWVIAASTLFFRPHEFVLGGADAGVYVNLGASIARSGGIIIQDPFLASWGATLEPALLRELRAGEYTPYYYLPGFYVPDAPPGRIIPQFYALHPVWQAIGYLLGQVQAELYLTGLWALLACFAAYLLVRRLWGWPAAILTLGSLTITGLQVWFARYPTSEMLTQYLFLTGVWAFTVWLTEEHPHGLWPAVAGAALGQLFLTRIDVLPLLAVPVLTFIARRWSARAQREDIGFYLVFGLCVLHAFAHGLWQSTPYLFNQIGFQIYRLAALRPYRMLLLIAAGGSLALLIYLDRHRPIRSRIATALRRYQPAWSLLLAVLVIGLTVYGYFVRPQVGQAHLSPYWYAGGSIPNLDHENLLRLGWYFTPFGLLLAAVGAALLVAREDRSRTTLLWGAGLFFAIFYLWRIQSNPHQVYAMRRYVPIVVPFLVISAVYAVNWVYTRRGLFWRSLGVLLAGAWLIALGMSARGLVSQVDYRGLIGQLGQLSAQLQPHAVLIYYDPTPVGLGDLFGTPLRFIYGHDVVVIRNMEQLDIAAFEQLISQWRSAGRRVYWLTADGDFPWPFQLGEARELWRWAIRARMLEPTYERRPAQIVELEWRQKISIVH